jgi:hypothetical protein
MGTAVEIFKEVKPKCIHLVQLTMAEQNMSGSMELLNALKELSNTLKNATEINSDGYTYSETFIPVNLADYIIVPITRILKNNRITDSELEQIFTILHILLKYSWTQPGSLSNEIFIQYLTLITYLIGGTPGQFDITSHSEETYTNGIQCIQDLLQGCLNQNSLFVESVLKNTRFVPTLGFLVSILLNISVESQVSEIKSQSLESLNTLFHLLNDGEILSLFFPGAVSSIAKIVKSRPHSKVISQSFITLSTLVNTIFSDFDLQTKIEPQIQSLESLKDSIQGFEIEDPYIDINLKTSVVISIPEKMAKKKVHRTSSWLKATLAQFEKALKIILNLDLYRYDKYIVRDSIFQFAVKVIRNCFLSCRPLIPMLLQSLSSICLVDSSFLDLIVDSIIYITEIDMLKNIIKDIWNDELHAMPHKLMSPDTSKTESYIMYLILLLKLMYGYGQMDSAVIENLLSKLQENIALLIEIKNSADKKKIQVNLETTNVESLMMLVSMHYDKNSFDEVKRIELFNSLFSKETEKLFMQLFKTISANVKPLFSFISSSSVPSDNINYTIKQAVYSWIVSCILKDYKLDFRTSIDDFLQFDENRNDESKSRGDETQLLLYNLTYSSLELSTDILRKYSILPSEPYSIVISSIMSLRSINNSIEILQNDFEDELIDVLYPVIECLASSNELVRTEAQIVTLNLANLLYDGSIEKLIIENSDYLIDSLSSKLVGETLTPKIPIILSIFVKLGSNDIVAELDDIIKTIFTLLDMYHSYNSLCEGFFLVFNEIISKIYEDLKDYNWEQLATSSAEENVLTFGMWGLKSDEEVNEFINKKSVVIDEMFGDSDDEEESGTPDEPLKKTKILEIDSHDSDDETDAKSIPSLRNDPTEDDEDKWVSPISFKLYNTVLNIMSYTERLVHSGSSSLTILLSKIILRIIPLLATQKNKFLPSAVNIWELMFYLMNHTTDLRVISLCLDVFKELIRYGNTFFSTRFMDVFETTCTNKFLKSLIAKQLDILSKSERFDKSKNYLIKNKTSTSTNWDVQTFNKLCEFLIFALVKLGRFVPNDIAIAIIKITIYHDQIIDDYGYFDDLAAFLLKYEDIKTN